MFVEAGGIGDTKADRLETEDGSRPLPSEYDDSDVTVRFVQGATAAVVTAGPYKWTYKRRRRTRPPAFTNQTEVTFHGDELVVYVEIPERNESDEVEFVQVDVRAVEHQEES